MANTVILAVEDNPTQQMLLRLLCKRFGFEVILTECCVSAMEAYSSTPNVNVVLMDWRLADGSSGLDCARRMREFDQMRGHPRHTPIVAMTASAMDGDREACLQAGLDDYLSKPFTMEEFQEIVLKWTAE